MSEESKVQAAYGAEQIQVLEGLEPVRKRPGMYIGKIGDGSSLDDGIYILLKEIIDNSNLNVLSAIDFKEAADKVQEVIK